MHHCIHFDIPQMLLHIKFIDPFPFGYADELNATAEPNLSMFNNPWNIGHDLGPVVQN